MSFADRVDQGYRKFRNPYHNPNHAADVAQTTHFFICQTGKFFRFVDLSFFDVDQSFLRLVCGLHSYVLIEHLNTKNREDEPFA